MTISLVGNSWPSYSRSGAFFVCTCQMFDKSRLDFFKKMRRGDTVKIYSSGGGVIQSLTKIYSVVGE